MTFEAINKKRKRRPGSFYRPFFSPSWDFICFVRYLKFLILLAQDTSSPSYPSSSLLFICPLRPSKKKLPLSRNFLAFSGSLSSYSSLRTSSFFPSIIDPKSRTSEVWLNTFSRTFGRVTSFISEELSSIRAYFTTSESFLRTAITNLQPINIHKWRWNL